MLRLAGENQWESWQNYTVPDPAKNLIWERSYEPIVGPNVTAPGDYADRCRWRAVGPRSLPAGGNSIPRRDPEAQSDPFANPTQAVIVLSDNNLILKKSTAGESLAWLTDLQNGAPIADQPVRFYHGGAVRRGDHRCGWHCAERHQPRSK
ncbi:MAG: hypothetical protein R2867_10045 [Caldilineaceae bacterium]